MSLEDQAVSNCLIRKVSDARRIICAVWENVGVDREYMGYMRVEPVKNGEWKSRELAMLTHCAGKVFCLLPCEAIFYFHEAMLEEMLLLLFAQSIIRVRS